MGSHVRSSCTASLRAAGGDGDDGERMPRMEETGRGAAGGGSPRRGTYGVKRPPSKREVMAALDPEAAERRAQILALRQRMKASSIGNA